jgi:hypothetical protein
MSDERMGLSFTIADGSRQSSHSDSRLSQPGGPCPSICIPQEQCGPIITPGTGFPFCSLLQPTGLQWRYLIPPLHGISSTLL